MKISGIYKIINKVNGKYYVGSSYDICGKRWREHKYMLNKGIHHNPKLQHAWNKYGGENFEFIVLEKRPIKKLLLTEQRYLDICREHPESNYNVSYDAHSPMLGRRHTTEAKIKMSNSPGKHSDEFKEKMRLYRIGCKHTEETRRKMRKKATGQNHSRYDHTIYHFHNVKTGNEYKGTRFNFQVKHGLKQCSVSALMCDRIRILYGWIKPSVIDI